ncbi:E3 ubiquitin-protein ligase RING1-like [Symbiodinium microadriaticum]|uniref:E3 ubiquitin-protein ligase RING1-like n=2 Tax=Symbiodinium TaxID=2949 RepID=A0A1Q9CLB7_SYMMI|nr:E3 ubiquitin-protein ligase RING1-like [Symbiodinium microadriaticum]CAE7944159.1 unnamed protein product [Symbiodinium sp. KB8]
MAQGDPAEEASETSTSAARVLSAVEKVLDEWLVTGLHRAGAKKFIQDKICKENDEECKRVRQWLLLRMNGRIWEHGMALMCRSPDNVPGLRSSPVWQREDSPWLSGIEIRTSDLIRSLSHSHSWRAMEQQQPISRCRCAACRACEVLCDELVLRWLPTMGLNLPDPLPLLARTQARRLRVPLLVAVVSFFAAGALQLWCWVEGWYHLLIGLPDPVCKGVRQWLLMYLLALTMAPFMYVVAVPVVLYYAIYGGPLVASESAACWKKAPDLRVFILNIQKRSLWTVIAMLLLTLSLMVLRYRVSSLRRMWDSSGPALETVINSIVEAPAVTVEPGTECAICLETDAADGSSWKALPCHHAFHEDCLLHWLRCGRRCPLCRLDLVQALLPTESGNATAAPADAAPHAPDTASSANVQLGQMAGESDTPAV